MRFLSGQCQCYPAQSITHHPISMKIPIWKQLFLHFAYAILRPSPNFARDDDSFAFMWRDQLFNQAEPPPLIILKS